MTHQDSLRQLLDDAEARRIDRRTFLQRGIALGMSASAMAAVLGTAGVAIPKQLAAAAQSEGGTLAFAVSSDPETLDPHITSNGAAWTVFSEIYDALIYQDLDLTFKGLLAESWEISDDNKEITFKLREDVTFTDGTPFNAEAVKFNIERLSDIGAKSPIFDTAAAITPEVLDEFTVKFVFDSPNAGFFNAFTGGYGGMMSPTAAEAAGDEFGRAPVGSGPYALNEWVTGSSVSLTANPDFTTIEEYYENKGAPAIQELLYRVIPEPFAQVAALETGEVDTVGLTATDLPRFENDDRFEIFSSQNSSLAYLGLTRIRPLMEDPNVRKAIAHAINRDEIVSTLFEGGLAEACATPLPPSVPGYDPTLEDVAPKFDLDAAKALLDEAGWVEGSDGIREKDGAKMQPQLYTSTSATLGQLATLIQAQLRLVGIDVEITQLEVAALLDFTPRGEHDMLLLSWGWSDPDVLFLFLSTERMGSSNRVHYSNPEFDELLKQGSETMDQEARMAVYREAQLILLEDLPWVPLYMPISKTAVNKRVKNLKLFTTGGFLKNDAYIED